MSHSATAPDLSLEPRVGAADAKEAGAATPDAAGDSRSPRPTRRSALARFVARLSYPWVVGGLYAGLALVCGLLCLSQLAVIDTHFQSLARERGAALFRLIELTREWNARHGGLYAPVTEDTPPNPYLDTPRRDVVTDDGQRLTLVNPAYMTRQIAEIAQASEGIQFHITSLKPVRAANRPDPWEAETLALFETGTVTERVSFFPAGEGVLAGPEHRYMAPLRTTKPCLTCHTVHGYALGDIRGGISVTLPAGELLRVANSQRRMTILQYVLVFVVAAGLSHLAASQTRRALRALRQRAADMHQSNLALAEQTRRLSAINAELETFAGVVSHDLRQPLRLVAGALGLIRRRLGSHLDADTADLVQSALTETRHMDHLILDLLDYARTGRSTAPMGLIALDQVVQDSLTILDPTLRETGARVTLGREAPTVRGHALDLVRLFQNLISNAVRYRHPDRPPEVQVGWSRDPGGWVTVRVADNGRGIPPEDRERVFQIFQRGAASGEDGTGTGLGLAICRKVAERHGGSIWVDPASGPGTTICLRLPDPGGGGTSPGE